MFLPYLPHRLCGSIWTQDPEPHRLLGPSLLLIFLVRRHQVPRGCPSAESETHEECLWTQPAPLRRPGRGHRRVSRTWCLRVPLFPVEHCSTETLILNRCLVQPTGCDQQRKLSQPRSLGYDDSLCVSRTATPPPCDASVCPLDTGALIGVRLSWCS